MENIYFLVRASYMAKIDANRGREIKLSITIRAMNICKNNSLQIVKKRGSSMGFFRCVSSWDRHCPGIGMFPRC